MDESEEAVLLPGGVPPASSPGDDATTASPLEPVAAVSERQGEGEASEGSEDGGRRQQRASQRARRKQRCKNPCVEALRCLPLPIRSVFLALAFYPTLGVLRLRTCCCGRTVRWYNTIVPAGSFAAAPTDEKQAGGPPAPAPAPTAAVSAGNPRENPADGQQLPPELAGLHTRANLTQKAMSPQSRPESSASGDQELKLAKQQQADAELAVHLAEMGSSTWQAVQDTDIAVRGCLIQGAFPLSFVLRQLSEQGVKVIVSNTAEHNGRRDLMKELGMAYHRPGSGTIDLSTPSVVDLTEGAGILHDAIERFVSLESTPALDWSLFF